MREREPILDVLRGFALLGILLVNIELMRGSQIFGVLLGPAPEPSTAPADRVTTFVVGWLVSGKFVSAFSILFGVGAALICRRALDAGQTPRGLLARRYGWLIGFGLGHMLLLFPGDVLFVYGLTGLLLLVFVRDRPGTLLRWSGGLLVGTAVLLTLLTAAGGTSQTMGGGADPLTGMALDQQQRAVEAFTGGSYGQVLAAHAVLALLIQSGQMILIPWFLALFLFGFAMGRSGLVQELRARTALVRRGAVLGLGVGVPTNLLLGVLGPLGVGTSDTPGWIRITGPAVQLVGAPILTIGYLSALTLICLRWGPIRPLAVAGRMALSAYLLQSALALAVFWGLGLYDQLAATEALIVVAGIWLIVLEVSVLWLRAFRFGPVEWLWRSLTYRHRQPLRARASDP